MRASSSGSGSLSLERRSTLGRLDAGIARERARADAEDMIWPVAALAVGLLGFLVVYGSIVQSRLASSQDAREPS
jgi:hypothetical protein